MKRITMIILLVFCSMCLFACKIEFGNVYEKKPMSLSTSVDSKITLDATTNFPSSKVKVYMNYSDGTKADISKLSSTSYTPKSLSDLTGDVTVVVKNGELETTFVCTVSESNQNTNNNEDSTNNNGNNTDNNQEEVTVDRVEILLLKTNITLNDTLSTDDIKCIIYFSNGKSEVYKDNRIYITLSKDKAQVSSFSEYGEYEILVNLSFQGTWYTCSKVYNFNNPYQ